MKTFPGGIAFKYTWRNYQQRVLSELDSYLDDGALHVVAPPGSGKTVLGLQVMLKLNKPALIIAPTIAVRNQWVDRFCELFLQTDQVPEWISYDIHRPAFVTVSTYQGLHAACNDLKGKHSGDANLAEIVRLLKEQNVQTFIADEAHHLKNEWWNTLTKLKAALSPTLVGLTATPPYDVTGAEWERYIDLNGPIDAEITVPELVREGDLCPHQDYIYYSQLSPEEYRVICEYRENIDRLFTDIQKDEELIAALESLPAWTDPEGNIEWIYSNMASYSSLLIFFHSLGRNIPACHYKVLNEKKPDFPPFDYEWAETLLDFYLNKGHDLFPGFAGHREQLKNKLVYHGATDKSQISFRYNAKITKTLSTSLEKLNSIRDIVRFEYEQLGSDLRLVVLTDYIRKEFLTNTPVNDMKLSKFGVMPVFEKLRRENKLDMRIGVLTGAIVIIPAVALPELEQLAGKRGIENISCSPLPYDNAYLQISLTEGIKNEVVKIVTDLFQQGGIEVLVGTKSLLGEGWDAPALNSLILASFVGSFVLSNQMRGRAIRVQKGNEQKTGNIWHLVSIDTTTLDGGNDVDMLKRRFRSFSGISCREGGGIENGLDRIHIPCDITNRETIDRLNAETLQRAACRNELKHRWQSALEQGTRLVEEIRLPPETVYQRTVRQKEVCLHRTIGCLFADLFFGVLSFAGDTVVDFFRSARGLSSSRDIKLWLLLVGISGLLYFGRQTLHAFSMYIHYRDISKDIRRIGEALLRSLHKAGMIRTPMQELSVKASTGTTGVHCYLEGGSRYEQSLFTDSLHEIVSPVDNPRYLILRKSRFLFFYPQIDYHAVPEILGRKKELAVSFYQLWRKYVGNCELVYTRIAGGRRTLLQARVGSLAARLSEEVEHLNKWR